MTSVILARSGTALTLRIAVLTKHQHEHTAQHVPALPLGRLGHAHNRFSATTAAQDCVQRNIGGGAVREGFAVSELDLRAASKDGSRVARTYPQHPVREVDAALAVALVAMALVRAMRES